MDKQNDRALIFACTPGGAGRSCECQCPDGPCGHVWDGAEECGENFSSATCSKCGASAMAHDMWVGP